jgi:ATP-dependent Lon protease
VRDTVRGDNLHEQVTVEELVSAGYRVEVISEDLELILGNSRHDIEALEQTGRVGVATGLAYQGSGNGGILRSCSFLSSPF